MLALWQNWINIIVEYIMKQEPHNAINGNLLWAYNEEN